MEILISATLLLLHFRFLHSLGIMAPTKQIHLNFMDLACAGSHMGIGEWK
jgi:hypothetical protein